jgi:hydroxypyruvate reductase
MMDDERLLTRTLRDHPWGRSVARILAQALAAVDPYQAVKRFLQREGGELVVAGYRYRLADFQRVFVVGAGKAGAPMATAVVEVLEDYLPEGIVIVKEGHRGDMAHVGPIEILEAGHPLPDNRGVYGAKKLAELLAQTTPHDLVVCLISGGGSALLTLPAADLTLGDLRAFTDVLLASGATINELNSLRKHLDQVKGGGLARMAAPAQVATLILSDVVGNPLDIIASGPTVPDPDTFANAHAVLARYGILERVPVSVRRLIEAGVRGEVRETPKPGDPLFERGVNVMVGSNLLAAEAAREQAQQEGFDTLLLTTYLQGEARQAGRFLAGIARGMVVDGQPVLRPGCVIAGGETTVTLRGEGKGGRNQELALGAVEDLAGVPGVALVTLATDGGDGPTDAAGAVITGETLARAQELGLNPDEFLARNDSYHFFEPLGDLLKTGPTQTNVNDLAFVFSFLATGQF